MLIRKSLKEHAAAVQIEAVNTSREALCGATVALQTLCTTSGSTERLVSRQLPVGSAQPGSVTLVADSRVEAGQEGVTFVFLRLLSSDGALLSRNVYWIPDQQVRCRGGRCSCREFCQSQSEEALMHLRLLT